ncbi:GH-E family nuclease [Butyrivibrio sp. INlla14]|uniref:GH-E family nuclease n=1 Tax=Butyrivibrio sp. INlla14 TaxID=1520808 RepID=UPI000876B520|nr:GH-E family nuclease [Butyrivibrio sp. INlla14]SCY28525.1 HNH/ENDO VII superfamily nuclease with conserved GHE residues [Butyrivibrio sp. INlla14]
MSHEVMEPRQGIVDFGHEEGKCYNDMFLKYRDRDISLQELKDFQENPENFRIEIPSPNRGHAHE